MTLPIEIDLPLPKDVNQNSPEDFNKYIKSLIDRLEDMYQDVAQNVNGSIRQWTPTVYGTVDPGTNITYTHQVGWLRRSGIVTELWMDVEWTAHDGLGGVAVLMPYQAAESEGFPWVGVIESQSLGNVFDDGYTYLVWNVVPDTTQGDIRKCGSGLTDQPLAIASSGGFSGYIQYLGKEFENT